MKKHVPRFLGPRAAAVLEFMEGAIEGDRSSQHKFRVAARSLRADLDVLSKRKHRKDARRIRRTLGQAIRAFGPVRDLDVGRGILQASGGDGANAAVVELREALLPILAADRAAAMKESRVDWPGKIDSRLRGLLDRDEPERSTMIKRARRDVRRQRSRALTLLASARRFDPERLHDLRKTIRRLRYALELLNDLEPAKRIDLASLVALQSRLGTAQDHVVLSRWLSRRARRFTAARPALAGQIRTEATRHRATSAKSWEEFQRLEPAVVLGAAERGAKTTE